MTSVQPRLGPLTLLVVLALVVFAVPEAPTRLRVGVADLASAEDAVAGDRTPQRWPVGETIVFLVDDTHAPAGAVAAVERAALTWNATGIDVQFAFGGLTDESGFAADLVNTVSWASTPSEFDVFVARTATYWFDDRPETIVGFDLVFNLDHRFVVGDAEQAWDVETVALHEFGHVLGLGHADAERVIQVMRPFIAAGDVDRTLSLADLRVLRESYGDTVVVPAGGLFRTGGDVRRAVEDGAGLFGAMAGVEPNQTAVATGVGFFS